MFMVFVFMYFGSADATGVIREEAVVKCGGEEALERAISRGDVVRSVHKGREAYFFPIITVGESEEIVEDQRLIRKKATTTNAFETVQGMLDTMGWTIRATEHALKADLFFLFEGWHEKCFSQRGSQCGVGSNSLGRFEIPPQKNIPLPGWRGRRGGGGGQVRGSSKIEQVLGRREQGLEGRGQGSRRRREQPVADGSLREVVGGAT